jgi:hypothetical protein
MNANDMLDYALGQLDPPAREQADRELAADPKAAATVDRLTRAVRVLLDDGEAYEPPDGLVRRTSEFVAEAVRRRRTILDFVPVIVPFRLADVAVAAGIFLAGVLTLLPAVQRSRERMDVAGCTYNLQQLGRALWQYGSRNQHYPFGPEQDRNAPAGSFVALLHDSGLLSEADLHALDCPCAGTNHGRRRPLMDFRSVCRLHAKNPELVRDVIASDYAYNVGHYQPASGQVVPVAARYSAHLPLLADQPPHENFRALLPGNSPNHAGRGQNVLYSDLHVGWHNTRRLGRDDDMFLNDDHQLAPGLDDDDTALLPSLVPFLGWGSRALNGR